MDGFSRDYESVFHKVARCRRATSLEKTKANAILQKGFGRATQKELLYCKS